MSNDSLLPCPGCAGTCTRVIGGPNTRGGPQFWAGCDVCRWRAWGNTEAEAIATWNTRAAIRALSADRGEADDETNDVSVWSLIDLAKASGAVSDEGEDGKFWTLNLNAFYALEAELRSRNICAGWPSPAESAESAAPAAAEWQPTPCPTCGGFCGDAGPTCAETAAPSQVSDAMVERALTAAYGEGFADLHEATVQEYTDLMRRALEAAQEAFR